MTENLNKNASHSSHNYYRIVLKATYLTHTKNVLQVKTEEQHPDSHIEVTLSGYGNEKNHFQNSLHFLVPHTPIHLIRVTRHGEKFQAEMIVVLPDFLVDISSIAAGMKPYGASIYDNLWDRLSPNENTRHTLLGHFANLFLDECLTANTEALTYNHIMRKAFKQYAFQLSACRDLVIPKNEQQFFGDCRSQFENLRSVISQTFQEEGIDREHVLLEPSFLCPALGLQGRLDLLSTRYNAFIELKSGKANEVYNAIHHQESHFVQMMLYYAVLQFNLSIDYEQIRAYLLYSRYPKLIYEPGYWGTVKEAVDFRNQIVMCEYRLQKENNEEYTRHIISFISPEKLNTKNTNGVLWERYIAPRILGFEKQWNTLSATEQCYVATFLNFICKEHFLSKIGASKDMRPSAASIWNMSEEEKLKAGEIITGAILEKIVDENNKQYLRFGYTPAQETANFRSGDIVIVYTKNSNTDNAVNRHVCKGTITDIDEKNLTLCMRSAQHNHTVYATKDTYCIERDYTDTSYSQMFRGLGAFIHCNPERRALLLGTQIPRYGRNEVCDGNIDRIVDKAISSKDYFLLMGPPGTGKTSQALCKMVEKLYSEKEENILLIAYTNKAVDEICNTLCSIEGNPSFIRLGQAESCDKRFHSYLLDNKLDSCSNRNQVRKIVTDTRLIVATLTTLCSRPDIFSLKHFSTAIIDEASQILEPQFLPIWCARHENNTNAIDRFIFIGDHKQLPAIVLQDPADTAINNTALNALGYTHTGVSLFERLYILEQSRHNGQSPVSETLIYQGRMHPLIAGFVAGEFYNNQLFPLGLPHQQDNLLPVARSFDTWVNSRHIAFIPTEAQPECFKTNIHEAQAAARIIQAIVSVKKNENPEYTPALHIGVIAPYRSQISAIRNQLRALHIDDAENIVIDTVERFQGGQRDVILFSCCINQVKQFDQLCNNIVENGNTIDRKLNVAITRARKQFFMLGNRKLLLQNQVYKKFITYIETIDSTPAPQ